MQEVYKGKNRALLRDVTEYIWKNISKAEEEIGFKIFCYHNFDT